MADTPNRLTIGEFSARSRISIRMLRHYDAHGVLAPIEVDALTGYRRYAPEQLTEAAAIRLLRDVGFGVSAIPAVLAARGTPAYVNALRSQRQTLSAELRAASTRLALLDSLLDPGGHPMSEISVTRVTVPARTVITLRGTIPTYSDESQLWARFIPELQRQGITATGPGGCIEHDPAYAESDVDESVWVPVAVGTTAQAPLEVFEIPEHEAARATVRGSFSLITSAHEAITEFVREQGLTPAPRTGNADPVQTKVWNTYLTDPSVTPEADQLTEVNLPLA